MTLTRLHSPPNRINSSKVSFRLTDVLNSLDQEIALPSDELSIANHVEGCDLKELNEYQVAAVRASLRRKLTLILGPPG